MAGTVGRRVYKTKRWRVTRLAIIRRDGFRCTYCGRRSGLEVHHLREVANSGDWFAPDNLATACRTCHIALTREQNKRKLSEPRNRFRTMALENETMNEDPSRAQDASPDQREQLQA